MADPIFAVLSSKETGVDFANTLKYSPEFNLFKYIYFYNGSGIGAGDFNNDGLTDLFFGANQVSSRLYLNKGKIKFDDVTTAAGIVNDGGWTTGISVVDINNDGHLDIYVCRVGKYETLNSHNLLLINEGPDERGIPKFTDKAKEYGLDFVGFSTQAAFFDYDMDGDLDMFLLNHSVHENGTFRPRSEFTGTHHPLSGDRLFRNDSLHFTDVTFASKLNSSAIGYGLGVAVADINLDGYPDMYIGNDFHENDYLYINQQDGTFREVGEEQMMHTSQYSMGVDVADINNDALPEIISMDMLPADPYILKRSLGEDAYDIFNYKVSVGYSHQYTRNNLQYNRGNDRFSEIGLYSGVAATDWSWAPLWVDFDNDGFKDLFISNGIPKRMNDIDYINFISNAEVQQSIRANNMKDKDMALLEKFPEIKLENKFYLNGRNLLFTDQAARIEGDIPTFSNGAVHADLDADGDQEIIVNNIDAPAIIYENKHVDGSQSTSITFNLTGSAQNVRAIGAKLVAFVGQQVRTYENFPVHGFMSSMSVPTQIGVNRSSLDSLFVIWPDNTYERISVGDSSMQTLKYKPGLPEYNYQHLGQRKNFSAGFCSDITKQSDLIFHHKENSFVEFDREQLLPHMLSTEGPAVAVADINNDGRDDIFLGSARNAISAVFLQNAAGRFFQMDQPALERDSIYEDTGAAWADINNDGTLDLVVGSGGNEFYGPDMHNTPRAYSNDGKGNLTLIGNAFGQTYLTASSVIPLDFNGDGLLDIFIGGRAIPFDYGRKPSSYLFQNKGGGLFADVTASKANELTNLGFVTNAELCDIDSDGDHDILLALEWGELTAFIFDNGRFRKKLIAPETGWWNFIRACDLDNDGDLDLVAGNLGLNSRLTASEKYPVKMYHNDFDGNGRKEQIITYYLTGREIPFANKAELEKQMPFLKKKFLYAGDFAKASLQDMVGKEKLDASSILTADYFSNAILINNGNLNFELRPMPREAQFSPLKDAAFMDVNNDGLTDIFTAGNFYANNIQRGRYDADGGSLLINTGKGNFSAEPLNGNFLTGSIRHITPLKAGTQQVYLLARNNADAMIIKFDRSGLAILSGSRTSPGK